MPLPIPGASGTSNQPLAKPSSDEQAPAPDEEKEEEKEEEEEEEEEEDVRALISFNLRT